MKMKFMVLVMSLLMCVGVSAQKKGTKGEGKMSGTWSFSIPDAPQANEGTIEFKKKGSKLTGEMKQKGSNDALVIKEIKKDGDKYTCTIFAEGMDVDLTFKETAEGLEGAVFASGWELPMILKAIEE